MKDSIHTLLNICHGSYPHECNDPDFFWKAMPKLMTVWHLSFFTLGKNVDNSIWGEETYYKPPALHQYYVFKDSEETI